MPLIDGKGRSLNPAETTVLFQLPGEKVVAPFGWIDCWCRRQESETSALGRTPCL
jgi:hypothetical protein